MAEQRDTRPPLAIALVDEPLFRLDLATHLEERGYEVPEGPSARYALRYLEGGARVALLVTDVRMPGAMDGLVFAGEVARRSPATDIVVVSPPPPRPGDLPAPAVFLGKPFTGAPARRGRLPPAPGGRRSLRGPACVFSVPRPRLRAAISPRLAKSFGEFANEPAIPWWRPIRSTI